MGCPHLRVLCVLRPPPPQAVGLPSDRAPPPSRGAGANGASQVLRRLSSCLPRPEDSGGPAPPRHIGGARVAFGGVHTLGVRHKPCRSCPSTAGGAVTPAASRRRCRRCAHLVRRVYYPDSAMDARLDTGGWLALTRQGLSPCKRRQAYLGVRTPGLRRSRKPERRTSGATVLIVKGLRLESMDTS